ncbi:hypothetical protein AAG570_004793 [Ranatra chinensis]|uniref:Uncharacterized protein n=1 Tax=Ranatra chinensis TaxID=642074 RepID=A0ABD0YEH4_9HEMI
MENLKGRARVDITLGVWICCLERARYGPEAFAYLSNHSFLTRLIASSPPFHSRAPLPPNDAWAAPMAKMRYTEMPRDVSADSLSALRTIEVSRPSSVETRFATRKPPLKTSNYDKTRLRTVQTVVT